MIKQEFKINLILRRVKVKSKTGWLSLTLLVLVFVISFSYMLFRPFTMVKVMGTNIPEPIMNTAATVQSQMQTTVPCTKDLWSGSSKMKIPNRGSIVVGGVELWNEGLQVGNVNPVYYNTPQGKHYITTGVPETSIGGYAANVSYCFDEVWIEVINASLLPTPVAIFQ
jgi:hypothetical protein